jgi:hypothetical protein
MKGGRCFRMLWRASTRRAYCFLVQPQVVYRKAAGNQARLLRGIGLVSVLDYQAWAKKPIDKNRAKIIAKIIPTANKIQRLDRQLSRKPDPCAKMSTK